MTFCERDIKQAGAEQCQAQAQLGKLDKLQYYWKLGLLVMGGGDEKCLQPTYLTIKKCFLIKHKLGLGLGLSLAI